VESEEHEIEPITLEALRAISESWHRPWPEYLEEFRRRAAKTGTTLDELAVRLTVAAGERPDS